MSSIYEDEPEEVVRRRAEFYRRRREGRGIIPIDNPKERLMADRKKHLAVTTSRLNPANLKKGVIPKPIKSSPILQQSRDADYFLDSIQTKLGELHNDNVTIQKQIDSTNERLDNLFRLLRKLRRLK